MLCSRWSGRAKTLVNMNQKVFRLVAHPRVLNSLARPLHLKRSKQKQVPARRISSWQAPQRHTGPPVTKSL
jgi:hypothetical protein